MSAAFCGRCLLIYLVIYKCPSLNLNEGVGPRPLPHFTHQFALNFTSSHNLITAGVWVSHKLLQIVGPGYKVRMSCCVTGQDWEEWKEQEEQPGLHNNSKTAHGEVGQGCRPASPAICFKCLS